MAIDGASRMSSVLGLNVRPSTATVLPRVAAHCADDLAAHRPLAVVVYCHGRLHDPHRRIMVLRRLPQRQRVLGEAGAAIARPCMKELRSAAVVEADAARAVLPVRAPLLAHARDSAADGDLARDKAVGGV